MNTYLHLPSRERERERERILKSMPENENGSKLEFRIPPSLSRIMLERHSHYNSG
jgi:hypothetical protein